MGETLPMADPARRELLERSLLTIRELRGRLATMESRRSEPVAVIGMACRFPGGATSPEKFWELLRRGGDAITSVPANRWPEATAEDRAAWAGGFLREDVADFDAHFFSVSPREAEEMDPQHRLLLETTWEAVERAGIDPHALRGSRTGVFVGISGSEYGMLPRNSAAFSPYTATGLTGNLASGRLAYFFGFHGPAISVDTACSSSLVGVHLACGGLHAGDCDVALAAGVNLMLSPEPFRALRSLGALAGDSRCKTFSAAADGYGRGEGCGVVVLKLLSKAIADGDPVLAVIRSSAVNQDGASSGLTVPNGLAQQALHREVLARAGVAAGDLDFIELHGTGTPLGDPIELQAISEVQRGRDRPLYVGAVKSVLGHLEAAAGIAGFIKVVLALRQSTLPPQRVAGALNPRLNLNVMAAMLAPEALEWKATGRVRLGGVSSFGFSGTNAHVILAEAPARSGRPTTPIAERKLPALIKVTANSPEALRALAAEYRDAIAHLPVEALPDFCASANMGRSTLAHRAAIVVHGREMLLRALEALSAGHSNPEVFHGVAQVELTGRSLTVAGNLSLESLRQLAAQFAAGAAVNWKDGVTRERLPVPTYPFQRRRYWLPTSGEGQKTPLMASLRPRRVNVATRETIWEFTVNWENVPDLRDNQGVMHVGHYQALVAAAIESAGERANWSFEQVEFLFLLRVSADETTRVQIVLEPEQNSCRTFRVCSLPVQAEAWTTHAEGKIRCAQPLPPPPPAATAPFVATGEHWTGERFYSEMETQGFGLGAGVQLIREVECGDGWAHARIAAVAGPKWSPLPVAPAVFDVCGQLLLAAARAHVPGRTTFMVKRWERVSVRNVASPGDLRCQLRLRGETVTANRLVADYTLTTDAGECIAEASGVEFQLLAEERLLALHKIVATAATTSGFAANRVPPSEERLRDALMQAVSAVLRVPVLELDGREPLRRLGLDSITGLEVRARVERETGFALAPEFFIIGPSIDELVRRGVGTAAHPAAVTPPGPWLVGDERRPAARLRLFCVPSGSLGASQYAGWSGRLPADIEVRALQLPGREERLGEPPFEDLDRLVEVLEEVIAPELDRPYAFYGHSMGALIAWRLAHRLWQRAAIKPMHFFPGAYTAPVLPNPVVAKYRRRFQAAGLPGIPGPRDQAGHAVAAQFVREGLAATTALNTDELAGALLPTMLADMQLVEHYVHDVAEPRFDVPITAFHGAADLDVTRAEMDRWAELTTGRFECRVLPGDHFFMHSDQSRDALVAGIGAVLAPSVPAFPTPLASSPMPFPRS